MHTGNLVFEVVVIGMILTTTNVIIPTESDKDDAGRS